MSQSGWDHTTLGDEVDLLSGFAFKSKQFTDDCDDIPLVKGANVHQGYIDWDGAKKWPKKFFDEKLRKYFLQTNDVVLAMDRPWIDAGLKWAWIRPEHPKSLLVQRVCRMRGGKRLDNHFLRYVIGSPAFTDYIRPIVTGVNVPHISGGQIKDYKFDLPPLPTQHKIAAILSAYDDLIENNNRRIAILEEMAQSIYREWFVNFRFPGHEQVKMVDSPLGKIPEGWEVKTFDEVCKRITSGGTPRTKVAEYWGGGIPWLSSGETGNSFVTSTIKTITEDGVKNSSTRFIRAGCTVIASAGQGKTRGQTSLLLIDTYVNQSVIALEVDNAIISDLYLYFDLKRRYAQFRQISDVSSRGSLTTKMLGELGLVVPSGDMQAIYDEIADGLVNQIRCNILKNNNLRQTRDLLLPKLISGKIDVSDLDIDMPEIEARLEEELAKDANVESPTPKAVTQKEKVAPAKPQPAALSSSPVDLDTVETHEVMAVFRQCARELKSCSREALLKAVSLRLGYRRMGSKIKDILKGHLRAAIRRKIIGTEGDQVWLETTSMETYTKDELRATFISVMDKNKEYDREDVIRYVAQHLGYVRLTDTIKDPIKSAINGAIRMGILGYQGDLLWREM